MPVSFYVPPSSNATRNFKLDCVDQKSCFEIFCQLRAPGLQGPVYKVKRRILDNGSKSDECGPSVLHAPLFSRNCTTGGLIGRTRSSLPRSNENSIRYLLAPWRKPLPKPWIAAL